MSDFKQLQSLLRKELNLEITDFNSVFLEKIIEERKQAVDSLSLKDYITFLSQNKNELHFLRESLHINYTQFLRSPVIFALLEQIVIPKIIAQKEHASLSRIRIWSAGCSTGQEAYSIAFLLSDILRKRRSEILWSVFATDISAESIDKAAQGEYVYGEMENLRIGYIDNFFTQAGNSYVVNKSIRSHINFSVYDLLDGNSISPPQSIFGDFDIIMCCNVLMYYNSEVQAKLIEKLYKSVAKRGCLILGDDETGLLRFNNRFGQTPLFSSVYYKL